jgi:hypothetical protein
VRGPTPLAALLLVAALLVSGCGGGGPQTQEQFVDDADAVCESLAERFATAGETDPRTPQEIARSNRVLAELYGDLRSKLEEIELPEGDGRAGARAYVDAVRQTDAPLQRLQAASGALVAAAGGRDPRALTQAGNDVRSALDAFRGAAAVADRLAIDYGFNVCGNIG